MSSVRFVFRVILAGKNTEPNETCHEHTIMRMLMVCLLAVSAPAQNPPKSGNPYISRGNPKSPNGKYEWIVRTDYPIRYALIDIAQRENDRQR